MNWWYVVLVVVFFLLLYELVRRLVYELVRRLGFDGCDYDDDDFEINRPEEWRQARKTLDNMIDKNKMQLPIEDYSDDYPASIYGDERDNWRE